VPQRKEERPVREGDGEDRNERRRGDLLGRECWYTRHSRAKGVRADRGEKAQKGEKVLLDRSSLSGREKGKKGVRGGAWVGLTDRREKAYSEPEDANYRRGELERAVSFRRKGRFLKGGEGYNIWGLE